MDLFDVISNDIKEAMKSPSDSTQLRNEVNDPTA